MARARNIKPGFFKNEDLAECSMEARVLFPGLWTLADREGRLEDRAKKIKGEIFPFDSIEVEPLLCELAKWRFIKRYVVNGVAYIQIVNFLKHQAPHGTEKDSEIPDEHGFLTVHTRTNNGYATGIPTRVRAALTVDDHGQTASDNSALTVKDGGQTHVDNSAKTVNQLSHNALIPDSGFLIPDSPIPEPPPTPQGGRVRKRKANTIVNLKNLDGFERWYGLYRRKVAKQAALKAWVMLDPDELLQEQMIAAVKAWPWASDKTKIPHPASWIKGLRWNDEDVSVAVAAATRAFEAARGQSAEGGTPAPITAPQWWQLAGFDHPDEARNFGCYDWNAREFRDGKRIEVAA